MNDLRQAAEMALKTLENVPIEYDFHGKPMDAEFNEQLESTLQALRQALAERYECETCANKRQRLIEAGFLKSPLKNHIVADAKKEPTPQNVDPRLLLGKNNNFTIETENRLCDIERRLAVIEAQPAPPKREWVGLTHEEIRDVHWSKPMDEYSFAAAIEAKLKEKNT